MRRQAPAAPVVYRCPCGKVWANTKAEARRLRAEFEAYYGNHNDVRFYACKSGGWHWTSDTERKAS